MKTLYMLRFKYRGIWHYKIGYATNFDYRRQMIKKSLVESNIRAKLYVCFAIKFPFAKTVELAIHAFLESMGYRYKHSLPRGVSGWTEYYIF